MKFSFLALLSVLTLFSLVSCHSSVNSSAGRIGAKPDSLIPVLSPEGTIKTMTLEKGFQVKLVASEPLINTPVAMTFDDSGRIWLIEMSDYHPLNEDNSSSPLGKVVILSDTNGDGIMDSVKVFMDSLKLPRAICLVDGGVLIATPPDLWFVQIDHDKPGKKILVDSAYTVSDNVEGQTNGLLVGIDNWIYSAGFGSDKRYRRINGHWIIQRTFLRGQWGITQDNYGHLFYNNNSENLLGDYFLPGVTNGNKYQRRTAGFNQRIVADNRVYPVGTTPDVNRGYRQGVLDSNHRLVQFTAACGPVVYNGGIFPKEYEGNVFVCGPAANLIKRDILQSNGLKITGKEAYLGKEFLASTDKRFRPVNLYVGPDGALYVVDMSRGVIQDARSLTDYLKNYSLKHGLNKPNNSGRIYKIFPKRQKLDEVRIPNDPQKLIQLLTNNNGWVRGRTQQKIVENHYVQLIPAVRQLLFSQKPVITRIRALWTLEGLDALKVEDITSLLKSNDKHLQIQSLTALISILDKKDYKNYLPVIKQQLTKEDSLIAPYLAYAIGKLYTFSPGVAESYWKELLMSYPDNVYISDAIISSIQGKEEHFIEKYKRMVLFHEELDKVLKNKKRLANSKSFLLLKNKYPEGYAVFTSTCMTCHGSDGDGIKFFGPPLNGSNWVTGNKNTLIPIILYGLSGPIKVDNKVYVKPEVLGEMPGWKNAFSDTALAEVMSVIRKAWNNNASEVTVKDIESIQQEFKGREMPLTMNELLTLYNKNKRK